VNATIEGSTADSGKGRMTGRRQQDERRMSLIERSIADPAPQTYEVFP